VGAEEKAPESHSRSWTGIGYLVLGFVTGAGAVVVGHIFKQFWWSGFVAAIVIGSVLGLAARTVKRRLEDK
jgi:hypothetical protein